MSDFFQTALNLELKQDVSLDDFNAAGFSPIRHAIDELAAGSMRELYIVGGEGFGKSHLAAAIYRHFNDLGKSVISLTLKEMVGSNYDAFDALMGLEIFNLIIIDDLQLLSRSRAWQESVFDLINRVRKQNKQLIFLSTESARELDVGLLDLVTRLSLAPTFHLPDNDDVADRQALIETILHRRNWRLPEQIRQYLLDEGPRNAGDIMRVLDKISPLLTHLTRVQVPKKTIEEAKQIIETQTLLLEVSDKSSLD
ncbi:chromosomal replication initiator DnaA [Moraxella nasovis]|uniref:DnaA ATPase domain-containing protein n=1 Tax=Moraxella nasovis TaxID=2904121 RepID=UPI001F624FD4|nr:DnaA/Hda family protein [Moraxella nasovis]UNU73013.1 chromosomal replication initiator DnaA [Moraxella nasovis]